MRSGATHVRIALAGLSSSDRYGARGDSDGLRVFLNRRLRGEYSVVVAKPRRKRARSDRPAPREREVRPAAGSDVRTLVSLIVLVALLVAIAHWPALSARALSFDDNQYLTENPLVQRPSLASAGRFLTEVLEPSTVRGYYQPLAMISLMIDVALGGSPDDIRPFHRTSLALHVANSVLVVVLLYLLFGQAPVAAMVGLLYGVHPLTVEPIPWVGERKTLLTTFFALWSLVLYARYMRTSGRGCYASSIATYALALLSKPTSTPLPVLMLLLDYWPGRRLGRRAIVEKIPFFVVGGISAAITYVSQARTATVAAPTGYSPAVIPLTLCHNVVFYLSKVVWPIDLSAHYPYPSPFDLSQPRVLAGVIGTAVLVPALLISWRWTRAMLVGWLVFFVAIFPTMGVVGFTHSIASDKYAYLPLVGLLLVLAWGLGRGWSALGVWRPPWGRLAMAGVVLVVAAAEIIMTRRQLTTWQDTESHFRHMLALAPEARVLHFGLGDALRTKAQALTRMRPSTSPEPGSLFAEAEKHYRRATRPGRDSPFGRNDLLTCSAHNNLGNLLARRKQVDEAMVHWNEVLRLNPDNCNAHNNLGIALGWKGRTDDAIRHYTEALRIRSDLPETHTNLGIQLARRGQLDEAIEHYTTALRLRPHFALAILNLRDAMAAQGRSDREIQAYLNSLHVRLLDTAGR